MSSIRIAERHRWTVGAVWDLSTGAQVESFPGDDSWVFGVEFSPGGNELVSTGVTNTSFVWLLEAN